MLEIFYFTVESPSNEKQFIQIYYMNLIWMTLLWHIRCTCISHRKTNHSLRCILKTLLIILTTFFSAEFKKYCLERGKCSCITNCLQWELFRLYYLETASKKSLGGLISCCVRIFLRVHHGLVACICKQVWDSCLRLSSNCKPVSHSNLWKRAFCFPPKWGVMWWRGMCGGVHFV